jgi:hypothetical protein
VFTKEGYGVAINTFRVEVEFGDEVFDFGEFFGGLGEHFVGHDDESTV